MQVLKDEIRDGLIQAALQEFSLHGYHLTSMRTIAKHANVTPGNVYAYFKNKEDLLDAILSPTLQMLHEQIAVMSKGDDISTVSFSLLAQRITDLYLNNKTQFLILMTKSHGTKYAIAKQSIVHAIQNRLTSDLFPFLPESAQDPVLSLTIASALVEGLLTIFTHASSEPRVRELVLQLMQLLFMPLTHAIANQTFDNSLLSVE